MTFRELVSFLLGGITIAALTYAFFFAFFLL